MHTPSLVNRLSLLIAAAALGLGTIASLGCGQSCPADYTRSMATLTLHLPPQSDVTLPEALTVCREPDCATGTLPAEATQGFAGPVATTRPEVMGWMSLEPSGVRVLTIEWYLGVGDVNAADPRNYYDVTVVDATGVQTGALAGEVTYMHSEGCPAGDLWTAQLSD